MSTNAAAVTERTTSRRRVILSAIALATATNLALYVLGRSLGGDFTFTKSGQVNHVDAATVAVFTILPLGTGLVLVGLLGPRLRWVAPVARVVAPMLAVITIGLMTLPVDLDLVSTAILATCHLTLVPVSIWAVNRLQRNMPGQGSMP